MPDDGAVKQHRPRPAHVVEAIVTGNTAKLKEYSLRGNTSPKRKRGKKAEAKKTRPHAKQAPRQLDPLEQMFGRKKAWIMRQEASRLGATRPSEGPESPERRASGSTLSYREQYLRATDGY